jgi:hypothetical protein
MDGVLHDRGHESDRHRRIGAFDALAFVAYGGIIISALTSAVALDVRARIGLSFAGTLAALASRLLRVRSA